MHPGRSGNPGGGLPNLPGMEQVLRQSDSDERTSISHWRPPTNKQEEWAHRFPANAAPHYPDNRQLYQPPQMNHEVIEARQKLAEMGNASRQEAAQILSSWQRRAEVTRGAAGGLGPADDALRLSMGERVPCFKHADGTFRPAHEDYYHKRQGVEKCIGLADGRLDHLRTTSGEIASSIEHVQQEHSVAVHAVRKSMSQLHEAVQMREMQLIAKLEQERAVKTTKLSEDAASFEHQMHGIMQLCSQMSSLAHSELDPDLFINKVEAPQAALYTVLDQPVQWESGLKIHSGWQLQVDNLIQEVSSLQLQHGPMEQPVDRPPAHQARLAHQAALGLSQDFQHGMQDKRDVMFWLDREIEVKRMHKKEAVTREQYIVADKIRQDIEKMSMEKRRLAALPDAPRGTPAE